MAREQPKKGKATSKSRSSGGKLNPGASLVASAEKVDSVNSQNMQRLFQPWQLQSLGMYDQLPEIKFAAMFVARPLEKLRLYVAVKDARGVPGEEASEEAQAILDRVQDPGGGRGVMLSTYGRLMFLCGEGRLICTPSADKEDADGEKWEFVSTLELRVNPGKPPTYTRIMAPQLGPKELADAGDNEFEMQPETARVYRFYRRHPAYSQLADASMQACLGTCEELLLLSAAVRAHTVSRLAGSGILVIPEEISPAPPDPVGDEDPMVDVFLEDLTESMVNPIKDPTDASAAIPLIVRGQAEYCKEIRHISIHDPGAVYPEKELRNEVIGRIATGLDIPKEVLTGVTDANHWTAWQVDEQTWVSHQEPLARMFCEDLTASYYRAAAKEAGLENWEDLVVTYDSASVVNHPNRSDDAKELHAAGVISDEALRKANGFTDKDAPTDEEMERRKPPEEQPVEEMVYGKDAENVDKTMPDEDEARAAKDEKQKQLVAGAAAVGIYRARELAGSRLRSKAQGDAVQKLLVDGLPSHLVASALGPDVVNGGAPELVRGAASMLAVSLTAMGIANADEIALDVEAYAARTLFEAEPAPYPV